MLEKKKPRENGIQIRVGAESADREKGIKITEKWYSNGYDQSLAVRL